MSVSGATLGAPLLHAHALVRGYGRTPVLRGVDLVLAAGETLAIVGPNGAGKTTLLRCLAGLLRPTSGRVEVLGRLLAADDAEARRPIGLVSHHSLLYDDLTLVENLAFHARLHGLDDPAGRARAALERVDLARRADALPRDLSRGMLQRAAIARALLHGPQLVLLDEPFTGLDADAAERLRVLLREQLPPGAGVVVVTHHPAEVWPLATRVAALVDGRWAFDEPRAGTPDEVMRRLREAAHGSVGMAEGAGPLPRSATHAGDAR